MDDAELATQLREELQRQRSSIAPPAGLLAAARHRARTRRIQHVIATAAAVGVLMGGAGVAARSAAEDRPATVLAVPSRSNSTSAPSGAPPTTSSSTTSAATTPLDEPSQSPADAARDGVIPELAALPLASRSQELVRVVADEGTWVLSRATPALIEMDGDTCSLGDPNGSNGVNVVCAAEYGEILLLEAAGRVGRAYPMPSLIPSWIHVTDEAVYAGRIGDAALPSTSVVRIDRRTLKAAVIVVDPTPDGAEPLPLLPNWRAATDDQATQMQAVVTYGPDRRGTPVSSWIGAVGIDVAGVDRLFTTPAVPSGWGNPSPQRAAVDQALAACLEEAGAEAHVVTGVQGGVFWRIDGLSEADERDVYESCRNSLLEDEVIQEQAPLSEAELHEFYGYQVRLAECLADLGWKIDPGPPEEEFVASGGMWSPYDDVYPYVRDLREWDQLQAACPQG
jgi:hypothetical protein